MTVVTELVGSAPVAQTFEHRCSDCGRVWVTNWRYSRCSACRYEVVRVYRDGVPETVQAYESLELALDHRDELVKAKGGAIAPCIFVQDADDPERGWLDEEDLYEEAPCS